MKFTIKNLSSVVAMLCLAGVCLLFTVAAFGQVTDIATPPEFVSMPKVVRPPEASGYFGSSILVTVNVNEKGRVTSVLSVSGPESACPSANSPDINKLREAAQTIALKAKFKPAKLAGNAVASTAVIEVVFPDPPVDRASGSGGFIMGTAVERNSDSNTKDVQGDVATAVQVAPTRGTATPENIDSAPVPVSDPKENRPPDTLQNVKATSENIPKTVSGGVLNGKAVSLPKPKYPPAAKAVRAIGSVAVQVLIGEDGSMLSASPVSGHPLLRSAARIAACSSRFSPTLLMGQPVKVSGVIVYNFVP